MSTDELSDHSANQSLIHVDMMIGSDQIDVDGLSATGKGEPIMRSGEFLPAFAGT